MARGRGADIFTEEKVSKLSSSPPEAALGSVATEPSRRGRVIGVNQGCGLEGKAAYGKSGQINQEWRQELK